MIAPTHMSAAVSVAGASQQFSPALMMDIELTAPLPAVSYNDHRRIWVLGRLHSEPVGTCILDLGPEGLTPDELGVQLWQAFREPVTERFLSAGLPVPALLCRNGLEADPAAWPFLLRRLDVLASAPFISIIICTRDRPEQLETCLSHLEQQEYPCFEIVVVDNVPTSDAVRALVEARSQSGGKVPFRYILERRPGVMWARNTGIASASGEILAFLDDDEEPDRHWLAGLACGFALGDDIGGVSGMVVPARLDTQAQELFEQLGGHCKGRGFSPAVFSRHGPQNPLYPLPPFGVGANMAFRRETLARIGGFDVALGGGTPACAGGDTLALTLVLLEGYRIAYEPAALMRHHHRRDMDGLDRQLHGYGVGLTAYYTALLWHRPGVLPGLMRLVPAALGYLRKAKGTRAKARQDLPAGLKRRQIWWMITGPAAYVRSRRLQARVSASAAPQASEVN